MIDAVDGTMYSPGSDDSGSAPQLPDSHGEAQLSADEKYQRLRDHIQADVDKNLTEAGDNKHKILEAFESAVNVFREHTAAGGALELMRAAGYQVVVYLERGVIPGIDENTLSVLRALFETRLPAIQAQLAVVLLNRIIAPIIGRRSYDIAHIMRGYMELLDSPGDEDDKQAVRDRIETALHGEAEIELGASEDEAEVSEEGPELDGDELSEEPKPSEPLPESPADAARRRLSETSTRKTRDHEARQRAQSHIAAGAESANDLLDIAQATLGYFADGTLPYEDNTRDALIYIREIIRDGRFLPVDDVTRAGLMQLLSYDYSRTPQEAELAARKIYEVLLILRAGSSEQIFPDGGPTAPGRSAEFIRRDGGTGTERVAAEVEAAMTRRQEELDREETLREAAHQRSLADLAAAGQADTRVDDVTGVLEAQNRLRALTDPIRDNIRRLALSADGRAKLEAELLADYYSNPQNLPPVLF